MECAKEITVHFKRIGNEGYEPCKMDASAVSAIIDRHFPQPLPAASETEDDEDAFNNWNMDTTDYEPSLWDAYLYGLIRGRKRLTAEHERTKKEREEAAWKLSCMKRDHDIEKDHGEQQYKNCCSLQAELDALRSKLTHAEAEGKRLREIIEKIEFKAVPVRDPLNIEGGTVRALSNVLDEIRSIARKALAPVSTATPGISPTATPLTPGPADPNSAP
jgi:hypothetical protein